MKNDNDMEISKSYDIVTKGKECIYQYNILLSLNSEFSDEDQLKMCNSIFYIAGSIKKVCEYAVDTNSILICKRIIRYLHPEIEDLLKSWMGNKGKFTDTEKQLTFFMNICAIKANIRMVREYLESVQPEEKHSSKHLNEKNIRKNCFRDIIQYEDKEKLLKRLHTLIDGKGGADAGSVLLSARLSNYLTRNPTQAEFKSEFELIGSWSAISNYMNDNNQNALDRANRIIIIE